MPILKKALSRAYDLTALNADVKTQVGYASSNDKFRLSFMNAVDNKVNKMVIQFGEFAV